MPENSNKKKGSNPCMMLRTRNKTKGLNLSAMSENLKQNEGIEYGRDAGELETKRRDQIWARLITTQIVLFHTLNNPGFEHFLHSNQPN